MANVVEIIVQGTDRSAPAMNNALKNAAKLGKGFESMAGAISAATGIMNNFGFSAAGIAATLALAGTKIATEFFEKIEEKAKSAQAGWDAFTKAVTTRRDILQPEKVKEREIVAAAEAEIAKIRASSMDRLAKREAEQQVKITRDLMVRMAQEEQAKQQKLAAADLVFQHRKQKWDQEGEELKELNDFEQQVHDDELAREEKDLALFDAMMDHKKEREQELANLQKELDAEIADQAARDAEAYEEAWARQNYGLIDQQIVTEELFRNSIANMGQALRSFSAGAALAISDGIGYAVASIATGATKASEAFKQLGKDMIGMLARTATQLIVNAALATALQSSFAASSAVVASTVASAWSTAAAMVSLASYGSNAVPAAAGIISTVTLAKSLSLLTPQAHAGLDYVPEDATYKLKRGEMVLDSGTSDAVRQSAASNGPIHLTLMIGHEVLGRVVYDGTRSGTIRISERAIVA